jgi:pilus assembly protein Flp/PilA
MIRLLKNDEGQDLIEYGLLLGLITLASALAVISIAGKVGTYFTNVDTAMP